MKIMKWNKSINFWLGILFLLSISFTYPEGMTKSDLVQNLFDAVMAVLFMLKARKDITGKDLYKTFKWYKSLNMLIGIILIIPGMDMFFSKFTLLDWLDYLIDFIIGSIFIYLWYREIRNNSGKRTNP